MFSVHSFRFKVFVALAFLVNIFFLASFGPEKLQTWTSWQQRGYGAGNSTLGFESILVVAPNEVPEKLQWRKEGLLRAAAYTDLHLEIPPQPIWTDADTDPLKEAWAKHNDKVRENSAYSWLGHLNALKVATTRTTSLILEDDVDWDVAIRQQMPPIAEAVRNLTGYSPPILQVGSEIQDAPFGAGWDILWLGHCGDKLRDKPPPISLHDPTVPSSYSSIWGPTTKNPQHIRLIGWSHNPMCTFAYAVTSTAAQRLLARDDHGTTDFDVWLHIMCKGFVKCVSVRPELFHHHEKAGKKQSLINGEDGEKTLERATTKNIWHSARCNSLVEGEELVTCMGPEPEGDSG